MFITSVPILSQTVQRAVTVYVVSNYFNHTHWYAFAGNVANKLWFDTILIIAERVCE